MLCQVREFMVLLVLIKTKMSLQLGLGIFMVHLHHLTFVYICSGLDFGGATSLFIELLTDIHHLFFSL